VKSVKRKVILLCLLIMPKIGVRAVSIITALVTLVIKDSKRREAFVGID